jgi:hypothetical protein
MPSSDVAPTDELSLPEMLRIMDVATALRQDRELVEKQLNVDELKARLRERLLASSTVTGEPVTPEEVDRAIDRYFASQNTFREPPRSIETALAHLYIRRLTLAKWGGAALVAVLGAWLLFVSPSAPFSPSGRARRELSNLNSSVARAVQTIRTIARDPAAVEQADRLARESETFAQQKDRERLATTLAALNDLSARLEEQYTLRVVSEPGNPKVKSGVDRYFTDETGRRVSGYYLIVQAVGPDGRPIKRRIKSVEAKADEPAEEVTVWAERVPKEVYDRLGRDKREDAILDEDTYGTKERGYLDERVTMKGPNGRPLERLGQITRW